ncbi:MAG: hypothetical protein ACFE8O_07815 [Candidatus Hermodarchaeota archaeon]
MEFPGLEELEAERVVSVEDEVLVRSLLTWSSHHGIKSRMFAIMYLATIIGIYAVLAISMSIVLSPQLSLLQTDLTIGWLIGYWTLMNLLFYTLLVVSVYCAFHTFWHTSLSTKGINWLQTVNYPTRPGAFSIEGFLISGGGRDGASPIMGHRMYKALQTTHEGFLLGLFTLLFAVTLLFGYLVSLLLEMVTFSGLSFPSQFPGYLYLLGISPWSMALTSLNVFLVCSTTLLVGIYSWSYSKYSKDIDRIQTITVQLEQVRKKKMDEGPKEPRSETPLHPDVFQELENIIQSYRRE